MSHPPATGVVTETTVRVNYSETDQMGVVYHANYVIWLDVARTEHLREAGMSYREVEAMGIRLAVADLRVRYIQPARYDDVIRIRCWVSDLASRRVIFRYQVTHADTGTLLATAETTMISLNQTQRPTRLPPQVATLLHVAEDA